MPVFILALSQSESLIPHKTVLVFVVLHVLVYPASNGYNSYIDKDESPIGGLEKPPLPTKRLFYLTLFMDFLAILVSLIWISPAFALCVFFYILASRAYSAPQTRLKRFPLLGFLTVVIFQGAFTYYACFIGMNQNPFEFTSAKMALLLAVSFQIAGAYPLTQVYQHKEDLADNVITLSYRLGYMGTFMFTASMFAICNVLYYLYFHLTQRPGHFFILQMFFLPIVTFFVYWLIKVRQTTSEANFKNTMRMNAIAALCMNACFILLFYLNNHS